MFDQDKIIQFLKMVGPTLPGKVAKAINHPLLIASAALSDLSSQGKVKISNLKVGGSPLYYLPGQEEQLMRFASGNMNPKDLEVLNRLKEKRVFREAEQDLLTKVSVRGLKDFAMPLQVTVEGKTELFWKWKLLSEEETYKEIRNVLSANNTTNSMGSAPSNEKLDLAPSAQTLVEESGKDTKENHLSEEKKEKNYTDEDDEENDEEDDKTSKEEDVNGNGNNSERAINQVNLVKEKNTSEEIKIKEEKKVKRKPVVNEFLPVLEDFFKKVKIHIEQKETIRKNAEMNFMLKVPTAIGQMTYFCKAKQKSKCDEKDLSSAYMEAQMKKLPLLFLYSGEMNKKAEEMLKSGAFENVVVKRVE
ncbi:hypothetical protein HYU21_01775 [Candidatus Woesearchaeota archaeon]|nr:hypothetical protein [Candidatus Woesearchaeota archaeon]